MKNCTNATKNMPPFGTTVIRILYRYFKEESLTAKPVSFWKLAIKYSQPDPGKISDGYS